MPLVFAIDIPKLMHRVNLLAMNKHLPFVMLNVCAMMTEIYTIEGGKKDVFSVEGTTKKLCLIKV